MTQTKTKTCASCNETKPIKDFQRRLTLAQSRSMLRNPNIQTRYIADSKNCASCRNQRRRRTPLSIKDIRNKISTGEIHQDIGENLIAQKKQAIPKVRARIMKEYWQKKKTGWVDELKTNLQAQVTRYANRYYSYKNQMPENPTPRHHALLDQHDYNYAEAKRIRKDLLEQAKKVAETGIGTAVPKDVKINELIKRRKVG